MSEDLDDEALLAIAHARSVFTPSARNAERVLAATRRALEASREVGDAHSTRSVPARTVRLKPLLVGVFVAVIAGVILRAVSPSPEPPASEATAARTPAPIAKPLAVQAGPPPASVPPIAAGDSAEAVRTTAAAAPRGGLGPRKRRTQQAADAGPQSHASVDAELQALRRVEHALRAGQPRVALSILRELDDLVPRGKLAEERLAASVVARCTLALGARAELFRDFTARYPHSVYLTRVQRSCDRGAGAPNNSGSDSP